MHAGNLEDGAQRSRSISLAEECRKVVREKTGSIHAGGVIRYHYGELSLRTKTANKQKQPVKGGAALVLWKEKVPQPT